MGIHIQTHGHRESRLTTGEMLEAVFSLWSHQKLCGENNAPLRTVGESEGSQSQQTVKYGHESHGIWNQESLCW
jgi:hypothetical protein